eukprot:CAMPEP_0195517660 /NCGR_PEP_ID=MMETSP0794_2-20130614/11199_1 /TAXON_ID=515487 /ORGANISM="Stephanopyxis turris, Strain CCMP 815" /LENGTH=213 /DNA_ID=CAMNT_0040646499 /DNA_START=57 /DNA_END=698 /DNA_ORIENTATION=+
MERFTSEASVQEIDLFESMKERDMYESRADLYAIILATEHLERSYARDAVTRKEYVTECQKLISQFRLAEKALNMSTEDFMEMYQMECPRAAERLLKWGVPEQIRGSGEDEEHHTTVLVAESVQFFITAMDGLNLQQRAVDELQPLLSDLMDALSLIPDTPSNFTPNQKVSHWLQKLNSMRAVDEISEDDARQLTHDLESAYADFTRYLKRKK